MYSYIYHIIKEYNTYNFVQLYRISNTKNPLMSVDLTTFEVIREIFFGSEFCGITFEALLNEYNGKIYNFSTRYLNIEILLSLA